jgi:hypothetical protein
MALDQSANSSASMPKKAREYEKGERQGAEKTSRTIGRGKLNGSLKGFDGGTGASDIHAIPKGSHRTGSISASTGALA